MQIRSMGNNSLIRAEFGSYLVRKDGEEIPKAKGYPADYKITSLVIPTADIEQYEEKRIDELEDEE